MCISYLYGAIDCLKNSDKDIKSYSDFIRKYNPDMDDSIKNHVHGEVRSAHWHGRKSAFGEREEKHVFNFDNKNNLFLPIAIKQHFRKAILEWIKVNLINLDS